MSTAFSLDNLQKVQSGLEGGRGPRGILAGGSPSL
jgi:hypothetical protein